MKKLILKPLLIAFLASVLTACNDAPKKTAIQSPNIQAKTSEDTGDLDVTPEIAKALIFQEPVEGVGNFTIKGARGVNLRIPRKYLDFDPNTPSGEVDSLLLVFYLPDWTSRIDARQLRISSNERNLRHVDASIKSVPARYASGCWAGRCLGQPYAIFQGDIEDFQSQENQQSYQVGEAHHCLKDGVLSSELGLVAYQGSRSTVSAQGPDVIYLFENTDPCNPGKWLHCRGHGCHMQWVEFGLYLNYSYSRIILNHHETIERGFQSKIHEFINAQN